MRRVASSPRPSPRLIVRAALVGLALAFLGCGGDAEHAERSELRHELCRKAMIDKAAADDRQDFLINEPANAVLNQAFFVRQQRTDIVEVERLVGHGKGGAAVATARGA